LQRKSETNLKDEFDSNSEEGKGSSSSKVSAQKSAYSRRTAEFKKKLKKRKFCLL